MRPTVQIVPLFSRHCLDHIHCIFYILEGAGPLQTSLTSQYKQRRTQWRRPTPPTPLWVRVHYMARKDKAYHPVTGRPSHPESLCGRLCKSSLSSHDTVWITFTASFTFWRVRVRCKHHLQANTSKGAHSGVGPLPPLYLTLWVRVHYMARKDKAYHPVTGRPSHPESLCGRLCKSSLSSHDTVWITFTASFTGAGPLQTLLTSQYKQRRTQWKSLHLGPIPAPGSRTMKNEDQK
jgi:hypothetical protein